MTALGHAEAATLGAVLLDPLAVAQMSWLRGADFADPWHSTIFDLIRANQDPREPVTAQRLGQLLLARVGPHRAALPRIVDLLQAVPVRPQPLAYASMVLEASIRRDVAAQGVLLRAGALQSALTSTATPMVTTAAMVDHIVASLEARWDKPPGRPTSSGVVRPSPVAPLELRPVLRSPHLALGADRLLAAHLPVYETEVCAHERDLTAALITHPREVGQIAGWLRPEHFRDRRWAVAYAAVLDLVTHTEPTDEVTVAWRIHQLHPQLGAGPTERDLHDAIEATLTTDPAWSARTVAGDHVRLMADTAAGSMQASAENPGLHVADLLTTAHLHTGALATFAAASLPMNADPTAGEPGLSLVAGWETLADPLPRNAIGPSGRAV